MTASKLLRDTPWLRAEGDGVIMDEPQEQAAASVRLLTAGEKKIQAIKVVRKHTGMGLKEAKALVDHAPSEILSGVSYPVALALKSDLERVGAYAELDAGTGDSVPKAEWWMSPTAFAGLGRSRWLQIAGTSYLGGWSAHPNTHGNNNILVIGKAGLEYRGFRTLFTIPWSEIVAIEIEGPEQASKRVSVSRALTIGVFALAAKKSSKTAVVCVRTQTGEEPCFQTEKWVAPELRAKITPILSQLRRALADQQVTAGGLVDPKVSAGPALSVADELAKFAKLRAEGILTDEEFETQKAKLLG